jgi:tetratricopeptide (TPR) repeat protein
MTLESGQVLAARYALLRKLGDGRTAEVWRARDREDGADRVLKVLRAQLCGQPDERGRFLHGARLQRDLEHPNIQHCTDLSDGEVVFAVFAHDAAGDLARLRGSAARQIVPLLIQVAEGVAALHARGFVHRDLKTTNVLLADDGRALLSDFGLAAAVGDAQAGEGGSPFTSSPEQLAGAPPAIADDVYAFGALACELLTGYPPFYPDAAAARAATAPPAAMGDRAAAPPELDRLVRRCLARRASDRPRDMAEVLECLRAISIAQPEPALQDATQGRVALRAPENSPPIIEPQWSRPAAAGPSAADLRSQGFRRGLLAGSFVILLLVAGLVFFALPRWVDRQGAKSVGPAAPAAPVAAPGAPAGPVPNLQQLADVKRQFEELRPVAARRLAGLEGRAAAAWGGAEFARGRQRIADADAAFGKRNYAAALLRLREADQILQSTEKRVDATLRGAIAAGMAALESGAATEARRQFDLALEIDAANVAAKRGLRRTATLDEVRRLLAEATELERTGQSPAAEKVYRKVLELDPETAAAHTALARLQSQATGSAFAAAVADGLGALSRKDYAAARAAYERAGRIRPGTPEVKEGLEQVERAVGDRTIGGHLEAAQKAEREERWRDALSEYRKALEVDANLLAAQQGVERAEPRAMINAELSSYVERPERVFSSDARGAARSTLAQASAVPNPGPVLSRQIADLRNLLAQAETPVRVAIASDSQTEVTIYRVGRLGVFDRKDMELLPGRYTAVGTRAGFRDVRREFTVMPGHEPPALVIRCEEQI